MIHTVSFEYVERLFGSSILVFSFALPIEGERRNAKLSILQWNKGRCGTGLKGIHKRRGRTKRGALFFVSFFLWLVHLAG